VRIYIHYTVLAPIVYTILNWIKAHIHTLHYAHSDGIHDDELDRCAYIYTTLHHAHAHGTHDDDSIGAHIYTLYCANADGTHDDEVDRGAYIYTTPCSCLWYTRCRVR
jgi:hypothetical protein